MTCTRCRTAPGQPRPEHSDRVLCDACAALPEPAARHLTYTTMSGVRARHVRWLKRDFIPLSKVTIVAGAPGLGKSMLTVKLAAQVSNGTTDGALFRTAADVLIVSAEDDPEDTIKPRLLAAGADCDRVHMVDVRENHAPDVVSLPGDIDLIERGVEQFGAKLVILDPVVAFLDSNLNAYREQHIRQALGPLKGLAERHDITVLCVMHLNKSATTNPLDKISNSSGFTQLARSVLIFGRDPDAQNAQFGDGGSVKVGDADEFSDAPQLRILASTKSNSGPEGAAVRLRLEPTLVEERGERFETARLEEIERVNMRAEDLLGDPEDRSQLAECVEWLRELLGDGPMPAKDVKRAASEAGMAWRTVERAKTPAHATSYKADGPNGQWMWALRIERDKLTRDQPEPSPDDPGNTANTAKDATRQGRQPDPEPPSPPPDPPLADGGVGGLGGDDPAKDAKDAKDADDSEPGP